MYCSKEKYYAIEEEYYYLAASNLTLLKNMNDVN